MTPFLLALKGLGAVMLHLGEQTLADPKVEQAIATLVEQSIAARLAGK